MTKTVNISEARRLLPRIVEEVAREGGRVDITRRGEPMVSIVRSSDLETKTDATPTGVIPPALRVEFNCDPGELVSVIRELRARVGFAREAPKPRTRRSRKRST